MRSSYGLKQTGNKWLSVSGLEALPPPDSWLYRTRIFITARRSDEISSHVLKTAVEYAKGVGGKDMYIEGLNFNQDELLAQGEAKGMLKGKLEAKIEDARNLFKNGASIELISKSLGFSIEQVKEIVGAK